MPTAVGNSSYTFDFLSRLPDLDMPVYPVSDVALVQPTSATRFLDGEFGLVDGATRKLRRPLAGDLAATEVQNRLYHVHGNPGRSDLQYGVYPVVRQDDYQFRTRLHSANLSAPVALAEGDLCEVVLGDVVVLGTTHLGRTVLQPAASGSFAVAVCVTAPDSATGWAVFRKHTVLVP